jgi:hypothetical protein
MTCYNFSETNCTSGAAKFLPIAKYLFNNPPKTNKSRSLYEIYKRIDTSYYVYMDDENDILEKVKRFAEEEMWARALRLW